MARRIGGRLEEELSHTIIGAFYSAHSELGYGFREHVYSLALEHELKDGGCDVLREFSVPIMYKGRELTWQRLDMVVNAKIVVEVKAGPEIPPTSRRQLHNYLRATNLEVGLLLHFGPEPKSTARYSRLRANPPKTIRRFRQRRPVRFQVQRAFHSPRKHLRHWKRTSRRCRNRRTVLDGSSSACIRVPVTGGRAWPQ